MSTAIHYGVEPDLDVESFVRVLDGSGLGSTRPTEDTARLRRMLQSADVVVTARIGGPDGPLVGIARGVTDFAWCCYLADLAVVKSAQRLGIGRGLLREMRRCLGPEVALILLSVPEAVSFYEGAGMEPLSNAFWYRRAR